MKASGLYITRQRGSRNGPDAELPLECRLDQVLEGPDCFSTRYELSLKSLR